MLDVMNFAQIDEQHVALLPARTLMGLLDPFGGAGGSGSYGGDGESHSLLNVGQILGKTLGK